MSESDGVRNTAVPSHAAPRSAAHSPVGTVSYARMEAFIAAEGEVSLGWRQKGFHTLPGALTVDDVRRDGLALSDLSTPIMTIDVSAVADNLLSMAAWCAERGLRLAPHGKTTMAPVLWMGQLLTGCHAITVANGFQLRAARAFGVPSVQLANELVDPRDIAWVAAELAADPEFSFLGWVDAIASVERLSTAAAGAVRPIPVCVEVGGQAGRTGARTLAEALAVAEAVVASEALVLAGVCCYEGAVDGAGADEAGLALVDTFLHSVVAVHRRLSGLYETDRITVTAGGSAFFDRVAAVLGPLAGQPVSDDDLRPVDVVLRSGAYAVHDDLHYRAITPSTRHDGPELRSAIHVWASVLSRPEPDLVIIDAGRRDLPFDLDLPVVLDARRAGESVAPGPSEVIRLNDQHGFVRVRADSDLAVGDVLKLGLSHPCTAFDKWRAIPILDSADVIAPQVVDVALTYF